MMIDQEQKRLKYIKLKYVLFPTRCSCCKNKYKKEKMWQVHRYGVNKTVHKWCYCQNCMHSAKEVLNEIDTDESIFGIAYVDDFYHFRKNDYTRMKSAMKNAFRPRKTQ